MQNGGLITNTRNIPARFSASGIWSLQDHYDAQINSSWPLVESYAVVTGTSAPAHGSTSNGTSITGWTDLWTSNKDDGFVNIPLGFNWTIASTAYNSVYVGSNNYLTFGSGSSRYNNYSFTTFNSENPAARILMTMTSDNSYQWVNYKQFTGTSGNVEYTRIRFEGNSSTSGSVGGGNIVWECTFFNPLYTQNLPQVEFRCGSNGRGTSKTMGIGGNNSQGAYTSHASLVNESVVYVATNTSGTAWTHNVGSKVVIPAE